ncbi:E3 ubiquitin-protein ligase MPSR1-like [Corylus avellana]|uniref:E3 ubiquitin-protein ligase MPSR1-like n=1 Tax=Corylus avellana TaxID=13451 RepID=UPI001E239740|nr:E3 ubiquitin-protein ligase MPSR1-like [Corylus avellana]
MASEAEMSEISSMFERVVRNRDLSLFIPFILGFADPRRDPQPEDVSDQDSENTPTTPRDRIILINPFTQGMVVIDGTSSLDSLLREQGGKDGQPPASKASIQAMPNVEVDEDGGECVICLDELEVGGVAKEMPCKHRFHTNCIEKWLGIHGSCPVCRYKMPVEEEEVGKKRDEEGRERRVEREIWVSFSFNSGRSGDSNQTPTSDSSSSPRPDHETEG